MIGGTRLNKVIASNMFFEDRENSIDIRTEKIL